MIQRGHLQLMIKGDETKATAHTNCHGFLRSGMVNSFLVLRRPTSATLFLLLELFIVLVCC